MNTIEYIIIEQCFWIWLCFSMFGNFDHACHAFSAAFKNFLPRIDDQSITVKPFSDGIDVFSFTGQRSDVGPSEYAPGHLCSLSHCDLKTFYVHWPAACSIMFHHFPMISHVILHLHNLNIMFPQTNLPKVTSQGAKPPQASVQVPMSFGVFPPPLTLLEHLYELGYQDMETWLQNHLEERLSALKNDQEMAAVKILVGWYIHRGGYPNNWGYPNS